MQISINRGEGLTHGIKRALESNNVDTTKLNASIWSQIMQSVSAENAERSADDKIFEKGDDFNSGDWRNNFVIKLAEGAANKIIELADATWKAIVDLVKGDSSEDDSIQQDADDEIQDEVQNDEQEELIQQQDEAQDDVQDDVQDVVIQQQDEAREDGEDGEDGEDVAVKPQNDVQNDGQQNDTKPSVSKDTVRADLEKNKDATFRTRLIDGKKQEYAMYEQDGQTVRVLIKEDGSQDKLVMISNHGKKQFVTESNLMKALGQPNLPEGVTCKCDENGNLTFYRDGKQITADEAKQPPAPKPPVKPKGSAPVQSNDVNAPQKDKPIEITPELKGKIQNMKSGIITLGKYSISDNGGYKVNGSSVDLKQSDFNTYSLKVPVYRKPNGTYQQGRHTSFDINTLRIAFEADMRMLAINQAIYQELSAKKPEELTDGEKIFMQQHEQEMAKLMRAAGEI